MEEEKILTGYCRQLDQSRMVTIEVEDGTLTECDCCYGSCVYQPNCTVAQQIATLETRKENEK